MTLKKIRELHTLCMKLPNTSKSMKMINAYADQALMNFSYETIPRKDIDTIFKLLQDMVFKFLVAQGR